MGKRKHISIPPYEHWTFWQTKQYYLNNCLFWIGQTTDPELIFTEHTVTQKEMVIDKERLIETIDAIEQHCKEMRAELLNSDKNAQESDTTGSDSSNEAD